ncbi:hypothetical protein [Dyadobacter fanqingshengii]|uniref:Uncharacterized protein n=1 Tax=Dyadobacter fanqingshengii TaxID=2906443 RepID=A0A9X1P7T2_9BACT|nr:hypothetical protein [Dyadobacter fanqingshengii]MCF0040374.1 hypothetical protein [Dyadobacter fanqingshengii]USJ37882.1 hypothetical protein NFI81_08860 [Dyadobacter fanqingshengii]
MAKLALLFVLIVLLSPGISKNIIDQDFFALEYLDDYPVKIDGGCSFFTYNTTSLEEGRFVFIISAAKTAFFKKDGRFFILHHLSREGKQNGYIDHFAGSDSNYHIILDVNKIRRISKWRTNYAGVLKISQRNKVKTIKVNGINEEFELNR